MSIQSEIDRIEQNVANTYTALSDLGADMPTPKNSDNLAQTVGDVKAVLYMEQTLTEEQQAQARANIGAGQPILEVIITKNEDGSYTSSHGTGAIRTELRAGRLPVASLGAQKCMLANADTILSSPVVNFVGFSGTTKTQITIAINTVSVKIETIALESDIPDANELSLTPFYLFLGDSPDGADMLLVLSGYDGDLGETGGTSYDDAETALEAAWIAYKAGKTVFAIFSGSMAGAYPFPFPCLFCSNMGVIVFGLLVGYLQHYVIVEGNRVNVSAIDLTQPTALPNPYALTINGTSYDGSEEVSMYIGDSGVLPQQYGAKGDGTTDDTAAFQAALAENRVVNVPGGTYLLSDTLTIGANCCLELSQDTVLKFTQTSENCIVLQGSATLRGNHAIISVPYAFTGNALAMDTNLETDTIIPPYLKVGSHMFKRQRFVYDINIIKPDAAGFCRSDDGTCTGTAVYMSADSTTSHMWMWAINISGLRIAGGFSYGIHAINYDSPAGSSGHYEDDAWNHDMRIEAVIEACEIGVALENCNGAHLAVTIQPSTAQNNGAKYAKHGVYLNDSKFVEMIGSRVWDWNDKTTLWTMGGEYQHLALIGNCRGLLLDDFLVNETSTPIQELIYTDRPANFDTMSVLQEPGSKYFKAVEGEPYFDTGTPARLALKTDIDEYFVTDRVPGFTDALATAIDTDGSIYNGIGYNKHGGALSSSGTKIPDTEAYYGHTGFIACKAGDTIYVNDIDLSSTDGYTKAFAYDADFNLLGQNGTSSIINGTTSGVFTGTTTGDGYTLTPVKGATAYMRLSFKSTLMGADPIISVNEEIKFVQAGFLADSIKVKAENVVGGQPGGAQPDWNAAEGEPGHILHRTHYESWVDVLPETVISFEGGLYESESDVALVLGETYKVTWNGEVYTCESVGVEGQVGIGDMSETGEYPFIIGTDYGMLFIISTGELETVTVAIQKRHIEKLPQKFLPDSTAVYIIKVPEGEVNEEDPIWTLSEDSAEAAAVLYAGGRVFIELVSNEQVISRCEIASYTIGVTEEKTIIVGSVIYARSIKSVTFGGGGWTPPAS